MQTNTFFQISGLALCACMLSACNEDYAGGQASDMGGNSSTQYIVISGSGEG